MPADRLRVGARVILFLALAPLITACGGDGPAGPPPAELPGLWVAIESEFVLRSSPSERVEIVALGGAVILGLRRDGSFFLSLTLPGEPRPWGREGTWISEGDVLRLEFDSGGQQEFDMDWRDDILRLTKGHVLFDFGTGRPEEAEWNLRLVKQASP